MRAALAHRHAINIEALKAVVGDHRKETMNMGA